jgi:hypothetical protein
MKKFLTRCFFLFLTGFSLPVFSQSVIAPADELILPQYMMTGNITASRLQYVCRLKLNGLLANSTYRYYSSASTSSTITTANAPGNFFAISNSVTTAGYILGYSSGKGLGGSQMGATPNENEFASANRYDQFTTDATGSYTGWFSVVPTSNAVFAPGNNVYFYVQINNGAGGTTIATSYRTTSTIHVVDYGTTPGNVNQASVIRGTSNVAAENIIFLYDNTAGTGRPVAGTWMENDGITTNFTTWYGVVEGTNSAWGAIIPNNLPNGVQRIEARNVTNGTILGCPSLDADGNWPGGANTVNPSTGTTPIVMTATDVPLQFIASSNSPVCPGSTIVFSSSAGTAYSWSGPSSFSSTLANPTIANAAAANAGIYTVQVTDINGCTSPATTTVVVNSSVTATVTGGGTICPGDSSLITFTFSGAGPWDFTYSNGSTSTTVNGQATSPYSFYAHTSAVYTVTAVTSGGCSGSGSGSATVNVNSPAAPTVTPAAPTIFAYNSITLTASGTGTFKWYANPTGGSPLYTGASYTPSPALTTSTTFYVDATTGGCTSVRTAVTVTVNPNPVTMNVYNYWNPYTLGTYLNMNIKFGGFSGLYSVPGTTDEFYTVTDRGPNLDANNNIHAGGNPNAKLFALPNFNPSIVHFRTQADSIVILNVMPIKRPNNTNTTGIILPSNAGGTGELALIDTAGNVGTPDIWGIDSEGLTAGNDNDFWMSEEYGTSVWHVDSTGKVINRYTPYAGTTGGQPQDLPLDTVFKYRNPNKGLEGVAYAPNGKVYACIQNMIFFPASAASAIKSNSRLHRIEEIDPATGVTRMFGYEHDPVPTSPAYGSTINNGNRYIGDAVAVNDHQLLVLEHGKSSTETYAKVYLVDINGATPITQAFYTGQTFEQLYTAATAASRGITLVTKTLLVDIISCGYDGSLDKEEGITIINDSTIAICNDNDFGVVSPNSDGLVAANGIPSRVYVFHLTTHLDLCRNAHITAASATTFCTGNSVTLNANTGAGFTYQWSLNGTPISGATSSSYTANASGNYAVAVTNATGCLANSNVKPVNVLALPSATVTAGGPTSFCTGGSVSLNGNSGSGLTYQWQLNNSNISGATNQNYTANASGNYNLVVTNSNGCSATSTATTVTVNSLPSATVTAGGPTSFCTGGSVSLNGNSGSGLTYQWQLNNSNISGATNQNYTANASGNYNLVVTNSNGCSATSTATAVTVNSLPSATVTAGGPTSFCTGGNVSLNGNSGSGLTYQWQLNNSNISGATNQNYTANASGNYNLVVTNSNGCTATSAATAVTVNSLPSATITPGGPTSFCSGGNVQLNANSGSGLTYQWQLNNTAITGATAQNYTATASGNYNVIVTNSNGCSATSASSVINVFANPVVSVTPSSQTFCAGDSALINAQAVNGYTYQWMLNSVNISGATASSIYATSAGNYAYTATTPLGCSAISPVAVVTVNAAPPASITAAGATTFCAGGNVQLDANTGSGLTYQWQLNNSAITGATGQNYVANASGDYDVIVTNSNGCSATSSATTVTVNPLPNIPVITQNGNTLSAPAGYIYQWYFNGNPITGATSQTYMATQAGNYTVEIWDVNSCSSISASYTFTPTGISVSTESLSSTVFPNPFSESADLVVTLPEEMNVTIEIYNVLGEKTAELLPGKLPAGNNHLNLGRSDFAAAGTYFIRISCGTSMLTKKVWVE